MSKKHIKRPFGPVTGLGYSFLIFSFVFGMATSVSGINLLYLIFGILLAAIPVNGLVAWLCVWKLAVEREFPESAFVGEDVVLKYKVHNRGRYFPAISVEIRDLNDDLSNELFLERLSPGDTTILEEKVRFVRRGYHSYQQTWAISNFPFGLTQRYYKTLNKSVPMLIYPAQIRVDILLENLSDVLDDIPSGIKGHGDEFHGLREYQQGDALRHIHWRSMARLGKIVVREFEISGVSLARIILLPTSDRETFEIMVSVSASLAKLLISQGWHVALVAGPYEVLSVSGELGLLRIMEILAVVNLEDYDDAILNNTQLQDGALCLNISDGENAVCVNGITIGMKDWEILHGELIPKKERETLAENA